ncbi:hypothetical protein Pcinc_033688 [Petrolisthes cinctipes]|uniref:BTB domain-containing protein n=1 Tax=Petrolisthes cinctipes TaxID=88211 RepID=A0AAE1ERN6_PETCI|nr:hypothetical protein Pcinc_033688 [Petrolisthes cinctipes]
MTTTGGNNNNNNTPGKPAWQSQLINPSQRLSSLLVSCRLADLTITFPNTDRQLKAHRLVLAMSSPVFEAMLYGPLAEEGPEVSLAEDPPEAVEWMLEYMYRGQTHLPDITLCVHVYQLASKYQMEPLMALCSENLRGNLTASNLSEMYDTAVLLDDSALLQRCAQVVSHSPTAVLTSPHLGRLTRNALNHLLIQPLHVASEVTIFQAIRNWGQSQGCGTDEVREAILEFLPQIRFLAMTTDEFVEHVMPSGVMNLQEASAILMNIMKVRDVPLPTLCSQMREKRLRFDEELLRKVTLATTHNFPKTKKHSRSSIFVHSNQEQTLVMNLRTAGIIQVGRLECKALNPTSGSACVTIKDSQGNIIGTTTTDGHQANFNKPVSLGGDVYSLTVAMEGHWPRGELGDFLATEDEVRLTGRVAYTEGRSGSVTLYFWSFN